MGQALYHYTNEFLKVRDYLDNMDLDEQAYTDTLESYEADVADKMENIIKYQKELEGLAMIQKEAAKELNDAAAAKLKKVEALRLYMDGAMKAIGSTALQAGPYSLAYRKGSEIVVIDEELLHEQYWLPQPPKPMGKPELKKLIKAGTEVQGVSITRNPDSLVVKM